MSERLRFRGPNPPFDPKDFLNPLGSSDPNIEELKKSRGLSGAGRERRILGPDIFGAENLGFIAADPEVTSRMNLVANGSRRERADAQRYLLNRAAHYGEEDLLDVTNTALVSLLLSFRNPQEVGILKKVGVQPKPGAETLRNVRDFVRDLMHTLSNESRGFQYYVETQSTKTKMKVANEAFALLFNHAAALGPRNFVFDLAGFSTSFKSDTGERKLLTFEPILSDKEIDAVKQIAQKEPGEITPEDFGLIVRARFHFNLSEEPGTQDWERELHRNAAAILTKILGRLGQNDFIQTVNLFGTSFGSANDSVRNCSFRLLSKIDSEEPLGTQNLLLIKWFDHLQIYLKRIADGDKTLNPDLVAGIETMVMNACKAPMRPLPLWFIFLRDPDFYKYGANSETDRKLEEKAYFDQELLLSLVSSEGQNPALDLLMRMFLEENPNQIPQDVFLELFDKRRPLGYFLDNLNSNWQNLQRITREQMWPEFITARQAKLWPSERELDTLVFSRRHPAEVLGFSEISFRTRGHIPPEVGVEFTFKQTDKTLIAMLDKNGRLVHLPFDLVGSHPEIYAFLEHIAVGSFEELVTVADKRVRERGHSTRSIRESVGQSAERKPYLTSVPRIETSYIRLSSYQPQELQSEEVIEQARVRERLPRLIPQKVVPLAYSQRYRYLIDRLEAAKEADASHDELRNLEGQMVEALSQIPRPSGRKLENLPEQFQLAQTADGKFLETWRVEYIKPKPREGEEYNLPQIFERRFRAAPIALTRHLETWFTQPPKQS